jgi:hypothetical protein
MLANTAWVPGDIQEHLNLAATVDIPSGDAETGAASNEEVKT